jgi:hypothetical protein
MSWAIQIPYRERSDSLSDVADAARGLSTDDAAIARQIVLGEIVGGTAATAGDLLDKLEKATPEQRRKVLDDARVKGGMLDTATVDARERVRRASHTASVKAGTDHRPLRLAYTDTGGIVDLNERDDDAARARHQEESRRHMREHREAERAVEAAAHAEHERAVEAAFRRELPPGFPA